MKFHVITFGCQMNVHDSLWLARAMSCRGWEEVAEEEADVFILNTCSVREKPEQKVYSQLGRLERHLKRSPRAFAAVGGCVAQQVGTDLLDRFPMVRVVFGTDGIVQAPNALEEAVRNSELKVALLDFLPIYEEREDAWPETVDPYGPRQSFVNIMQGCDNFCSYCIVPFVRGRQKSRMPDAVVQECRDLVARGTREITLLGQNVNSYGLDSSGAGIGFAELLHRVAAISGLDRLRFTTSHPKDIADEVIAAFGELENLCPHLHLPMQSGADKVLKRMGRKYDTRRYLEIIDKLRAARPDIALGTDLIVGFPGETEEDFQQTLDMVEQVGFESSYSFKYSDRPGVAAVRMTPKVDPATASQRLERLQDLQNQITKESLKKYIGTETDVLIDSMSKVQDSGGVSWRGRDPGGRIVNVKNLSAEGLAGQMLPVKIIEAKKHSLLGEKVGEAW